MLNQRSQQLVQDAVRLNLAALVKQTPKSARHLHGQFAPEGWQVLFGGQQLLWLCNTAGPAAVNTQNNTCAILEILDNMLLTEADTTAG
jgi:hypothetical protein